MKSALMYYAAGSLALAILILIQYVLNQVLGSHWHLYRSLIPFVHETLSLQLVIAGLSGLLLLIPIANSQLLTKSLFTALIPTIILLLVVYPFYKHIGFGGIKLHMLTPFVTFFYCWAWSLLTLISARL